MGPQVPLYPPVLSVPKQQKPTFFDSVKEGFSFGVGASLARNVVDSLFSKKTDCTELVRQYESCMKNSSECDKQKDVMIRCLAEK